MPPPPDLAGLTGQLRTAGLRVTRPRIAALEAVHANPHADTDTILGAVRAGLPEVSRQAVYDVLAALTGAGLIRRIQPSGSVARYESRVGDNHHHVVCRTCGVIGDVDCAVGEAPCLAADSEVLEGFELDEAEVIYWGQCPDCVNPRDVNPRDVNPRDVNPRDVNPRDGAHDSRSQS